MLVLMSADVEHKPSLPPPAVEEKKQAAVFGSISSQVPAARAAPAVSAPAVPAPAHNPTPQRPPQDRTEDQDEDYDSDDASEIDYSP